MSKAVISDKTKHITRWVKPADFSNSKIKYKSGNVKINHTLPFKVKFINIGIASYSPSRPAPIGIAVIGVNNYVL
jgi:hypothetical protein